MIARSSRLAADGRPPAHLKESAGRRLLPPAGRARWRRSDATSCTWRIRPQVRWSRINLSCVLRVVDVLFFALENAFVYKSREPKSWIGIPHSCIACRRSASALCSNLRSQRSRPRRLRRSGACRDIADLAGPREQDSLDQRIRVPHLVSSDSLVFFSRSSDTPQVASIRVVQVILVDAVQLVFEDEIVGTRYLGVGLECVGGALLRRPGEPLLGAVQHGFVSFQWHVPHTFLTP